MTYQQYDAKNGAVRLLWYLANEDGPRTITEIADAMGVERDTIKTTVSRLYAAAKKAEEPYLERERRFGEDGNGYGPYEYAIGPFTERDASTVPPPKDDPLTRGLGD